MMIIITITIITIVIITIIIIIIIISPLTFSSDLGHACIHIIDALSSLLVSSSSVATL